MTKTEIFEESDFSRKFIRWCVGGGLLLAFVLLLFILGVIPLPSYGAGGPAGISMMITIFPFIIEFYMLYITAIIGGIVVVLQFWKHKYSWIISSIFTLSFILAKLSLILIYILILTIWGAAGYLALDEILLVYIFIPFLFGWFLYWFVNLYKYERIKFRDKQPLRMFIVGLVSAIILSSLTIIPILLYV